MCTFFVDDLFLAIKIISETKELLPYSLLLEFNLPDFLRLVLLIALQAPLVYTFSFNNSDQLANTPPQVAKGGKNVADDNKEALRKLKEINRLSFHPVRRSGDSWPSWYRSVSCGW